MLTTGRTYIITHVSEVVVKKEKKKRRKNVSDSRVASTRQQMPTTRGKKPDDESARMIKQIGMTELRRWPTTVFGCSIILWLPTSH